MRAWWAKIRAALSGRRGFGLDSGADLNSDLREEIEVHLDLEIQERIASGMPAEQAAREARRGFGNAVVIREQAREAWSFARLEILAKDFVYAARQLRRNPGFAAVAMLTLAMGIGANAAIFSVVNGVLLSPLPYTHPERLMLGHGRTPNGFTGAAVSAPDFLDYRGDSRAFDYLAAFFAPGTTSESWSYKGHTRQLRAGMVTAGFFETLGCRPLLGRTFTLGDEETAVPRAVVIGYPLWQRLFAGDAGAIGQTVTLDGNAVIVVGVIAPGLDFPKGADFWFPTPMKAQGLQRRGGHMFLALGRLKPDATQAQAQNELDAIALRLGERYPGSDAGWGLHLQTLQEAIVGPSRPALVMLLGAVGLVLLIACANLANLLLARYGARQREISVRMAIGAGRWRILSQFLVENLLLAAIAGLIALALAYWGIALLRELGPASLPRLQEVRLDGRVLRFTAALSALTALVFGLGPAWHATASTSADLRVSARSGMDRRRHLLGRALVVAETAISISLLIGATLLIESFYRTLHASPGFASRGVVTAEMMLPKSGGDTQRLQLVDTILRRARALPGVQAAGGISELPINNEFDDVPFDIVEHPSGGAQNRYDEDFRRVTPGYFEAMQIPLLRGRYLNDGDRPASMPCVVVDEPFAQRYFPNEDPIGKHIRLATPVTIVGVVGGVRNHTLDTAPRPTMYLSFAQEQSDNLHLVLRVPGNPEGLDESVGRIVTEADPNVALSVFVDMDSLISRSVAGSLFETLLLGLFAGLALTLAIAGVYGVFSYIVTQQTQEIGVRMALGATPGRILGQVLGRGAALAAVGAVLGMAGAYFVVRALASQLYEVNPRDPVAFALSSGVLVAVAVCACAIPARRAMNVDPVVALRCE